MNRPVLFFDWDGTIADSMPLCIEEVTLALQRMGLPVPPEAALRACNGPTYEETIPMLGIPPQRGEEYLRLRHEAELELVPRVLRLFPGVEEMLRTLCKTADLAVVSNGQPDYIITAAGLMHIEDCFVRLQGQIPGKTKAQLLEMLLTELQPSRSLMIGDRLGDIRAGQANGLTTVAAAYGFGNEAEYSQADYQAYTVPGMTALLLDLLA